MAVNTWNPDVIAEELDADGVHHRVGRDKEDAGIAYDVLHQVLMTEWNPVKSAVKWLHTKVGTETLSAFDSLRGKLGGDHLFFQDSMGGIAAAALEPPWTTIGGGDWHYGTNPDGKLCASGTLDAVDLAILQQGPVHRLESPRFKFRLGVDGSPGTGVFVGLSDFGGMPEECGVEFVAAANAVNGFINSGGARVATVALGAWVSGTEHRAEVRVSSAGAVTASFDGGTFTAIGTLAAAECKFFALTSADGGGGKLAYLRQAQLIANWP